MTVVFGVAGVGLNASGWSVVPYGLTGSFQSATTDVVTTPVNAAFFVRLIVTPLFRFWVFPIETVDGTVIVKSGIVMTVPE